MFIWVRDTSAQADKTTQPLPEATHPHPHVADGNRVRSVFSLKAEQMPTVSEPTSDDTIAKRQRGEAMFSHVLLLFKLSLNKL